ncbi:hypothetical protein E2C01_044564 [Portunus trituberculatus]|uniref:Uncharacterized protein n=1 Tax=Portunus trituberculatus TaxID=210409 RepID=A0A5B7G2P4_PORTR|nr:hypothetical protein [Portunus trituberculatus]
MEIWRQDTTSPARTLYNTTSLPTLWHVRSFKCGGSTFPDFLPASALHLRSCFTRHKWGSIRLGVSSRGLVQLFPKSRCGKMP